MSGVEKQLELLTEKIDTLTKRVAELEKGGGARPAKKSSGVKRSASGTSTSSSSSSSSSKKTVKKSSSKSSVRSRPPTASRRKSTDFKAEEVDPELQGSYYVGKRKITYVMPDSMKGVKPPTSTKGSLALEYVFGYNGKTCRNNIALTDDGDIIYAVAATGVVMNLKSREQRYFVGGHDEDIVSFARHPSKPLIATGQTDPKGAGKPYVCVWDYESKEPSEVGRLGEFHDRGISFVAFSPDGKTMATIGMDDSHTLGVWDVPSGGKTVKKPKLHATASKDPVYGLAFGPGKELNIVTVGKSAVKFWTKQDGRLKGTSPSMASKNKKDKTERVFLSAAFLASGDVAVGGDSGTIYILKEGKVVKRLKEHASKCGAITALPDGGFVSAGSDGVIEWTEDFKVKNKVETKVRPVAIAVNGKGTEAVVGSADNSVTHVQLGKSKSSKIVSGHSGEIWALAVHPSKDILATGAHDRTVRIWDAKKKEETGSYSFDSKQDEVRSLAFSPDGSQLAVGTKTGRLTVLSFPKLEVLHTKRHRKEQIDALNYSPNGQVIAIGSWDQMVEFVDVESKSSVTCRGHTSSITHLTFSTDSKFVMTNSRDYEILYWNVETGKRVPTSKCRELEWADWQNVLGWPVRNVFGSGMDGTDINAVNVSHDKSSIVAGDDFGQVHLFAYPAVSPDAKGKNYPGHSSHVTNVRFSHDDSRVYSCGGLDYGIFMWSHAS